MTSSSRNSSRSLQRIRPLADFMHTEAAGGLILVVATVVALVWANSPWKDSYNDLWHTHIAVSVGSHTLELSLQHWVNDGLMAIFFFVVGLEIKRELVQGELRDPRRAALPAFAALGGMVVPALLFTLAASGTDGSNGWGIPMATDIAMAVGVVALLGSRVHPSLKLFLLALAIVDDLGAILVIAIFYSDSIDGAMLGLAVLSVAWLAVMRVTGVRWIPAYIVAGTALWLTLHEAGVHSTIAGVICGLLAPTVPHHSTDMVDVEEIGDLEPVEAVRATVTQARNTVSVVEWLEHLLHPWTSFLIVPIFALANAGVAVDGDAVSDALGSRVTLGVVLGLLVGKPLGITLASWISVRLGFGALPPGVGWRALFAISSVAGIGFTVSLFVTDLAFDSDALDGEAKLGVLTASLLSAILGSALVVLDARRRRVRAGGASEPVAAQVV